MYSEHCMYLYFCPSFPLNIITQCNEMLATKLSIFHLSIEDCQNWLIHNQNTVKCFRVTSFVSCSKKSFSLVCFSQKCVALCVTYTNRVSMKTVSLFHNFCISIRFVLKTNMHTETHQNYGYKERRNEKRK